VWRVRYRPGQLCRGAADAESHHVRYRRALDTRIRRCLRGSDHRGARPLSCRRKPGRHLRLYLPHHHLHPHHPARCLVGRPYQHRAPRPQEIAGVSTTMELAAHAKVNLLLRVLAREADGYHNLETLFCRISLADTLRAEKVEGRSV